jgi:hypothetical protein
MKSTNRFDARGNEIFIGDKVTRAWAWFNYRNKSRTAYRVHTITEQKAFMGGDGIMREDEPGTIYCTGMCVNRWTGPELIKLLPQHMEMLNQIEEEKDYFINDEGKPQKVTDRERFDMSDENWTEYVKEMERIERKFMWGK